MATTEAGGPMGASMGASLGALTAGLPAIPGVPKEMQPLALIAAVVAIVLFIILNMSSGGAPFSSGLLSAGGFGATAVIMQGGLNGVVSPGGGSAGQGEEGTPGTGEQSDMIANLHRSIGNFFGMAPPPQPKDDDGADDGSDSDEVPAGKTQQPAGKPPPSGSAGNANAQQNGYYQDQQNGYQSRDQQTVSQSRDQQYRRQDAVRRDDGRQDYSADSASYQQAPAGDPSSRSGYVGRTSVNREDTTHMWGTGSLPQPPPAQPAASNTQPPKQERKRDKVKRFFGGGHKDKEEDTD